MVSRCFKMFNGWFPDVPVSFHFDQPTDLSKGMNLENFVFLGSVHFRFPHFLLFVIPSTIYLYIYIPMFRRVLQFFPIFMTT